MAGSAGDGFFQPQRSPIQKENTPDLNEVVEVVVRERAARRDSGGFDSGGRDRDQDPRRDPRSRSRPPPYPGRELQDEDRGHRHSGVDDDSVVLVVERGPGEECGELRSSERRDRRRGTPPHGSVCRAGDKEEARETRGRERGLPDRLRRKRREARREAVPRASQERGRRQAREAGGPDPRRERPRILPFAREEDGGGESRQAERVVGRESERLRDQLAPEC